MAGKGTGGGGPQTKDIGAHILIVEARYYEAIADEMVAGATAVLDAHGCSFERVAVPGALEIPQALAAAIESGRFDPLADDGRPFDGIIAIGCVIRGETYHFEIVAETSAAGIQRVQLDTGVPVANGVLTTDTDEQAEARLEKGAEAARVAIEMTNLLRAIDDE